MQYNKPAQGHRKAPSGVPPFWANSRTLISRLGVSPLSWLTDTLSATLFVDEQITEVGDIATSVGASCPLARPMDAESPPGCLLLIGP